MGKKDYRCYAKYYADNWSCFVVFLSTTFKVRISFLLLPTCIVLERTYHKAEVPTKYLCLLVLIPLLCSYAARVTHIDNVDLVKQDDYKTYSTYEISLNGATVWLPEEGDQVEYEAFTGSPHIELMSIIELRGTDIAEGFKVKEEFKDSVLKSDGYEWVQ